MSEFGSKVYLVRSLDWVRHVSLTKAGSPLLAYLVGAVVEEDILELKGKENVGVIFHGASPI